MKKEFWKNLGDYEKLIVIVALLLILGIPGPMIFRPLCFLFGHPKFVWIITPVYIVIMCAWLFTNKKES